MELSPSMLQRNLSTNISSSDWALWRTAMEMAAASYLSSGRPTAAICSAVSSSVWEPYKVSRSWASVQTLLSVLSAHLKKIIWRPNILVMGLLLREVAGQLSASSWQSS